MKYFTISELIKSDTAIERRIWNGASKAVEDNLRQLVDNILDPLRERWGKPITVNSGHRCPEINKAVGGVPNSQHVTGCAADITTGSVEGNRALMRLLVDGGLHYDQLIDEANYKWLHVSFNPCGVNRRQLLRMRGGKYTDIKEDEI